MYDIAIVGAPSDCWAMALLLVTQLNILKLRIAVVSLTQADEEVTIVSTSPSIRRFHQLLGVSEQELMRRSIAWPLLGIDISACESAPQFFYSYGSDPSGDIDVNWAVIATRLVSPDFQQGSLSLAATMARLGKFIDPERVPHAVYQSLGVGLQLHLAGYSDLLREQAIAMGVVEFVAQTVSSIGNSSEPLIDLLRLDSQQEISAELFIDFSSAGLLGGDPDFFQTINIVSRQYSGTKSSDGPFTQLLVRDQQFYSLTNIASTFCLHYYNVQQAGAPVPTKDINFVINDAWKFFPELSTEKIEQKSLLKFNDGACWKGNCVRIPPATNAPWDLLLGYGEITRQSMMRLLDCYASTEAMLGASEEFNRLSLLATKEYQQLIVVFLMLTSTLSDEQLQVLVEPVIYEEALHSINLFKSSAIVSSYLSSLLSHDQWMSLFIGFGVVPATGGIHFDSITIEKMTSIATQRRAQVKHVSERAPSLNEYINYLLKI